MASCTFSLLLFPLFFCFLFLIQSLLYADFNFKSLSMRGMSGYHESSIGLLYANWLLGYGVSTHVVH